MTSLPTREQTMRDFSRRTAALMIRLENTRAHSRPAYRWLALVHQRTAVGVYPGEADWMELQRLEVVL
jgi:hypothetical protein